MLDIFRWTALFAAIVMVVAVAGAIVVSSQQPLQPTEQQAAEKNKTENPAQEGNKTLWDRWFPDSISFYTLFLVVFTGVLAIGGIYQLKFLGRAEQISATAANAAKESADATREAVRLSGRTAERQLRAYVYLDIAGRKYPPPPKEPNRYSVSLDIKNGGSTWARNLKIRHGMVVDPKQADPFDGVEWDKITPNPMVLGPGQSTSMQFGDVDGETLREMISGHRRVFFVAWITYEDVLSDPPVTRHTQLSRQLNADAEGGVAFSWVKTHNCADDDCPK